MRFRKLRIAWSVVCGIACVLLIVLWVRSYWWGYSLRVPTTQTRALIVDSMEGNLSFVTLPSDLINPNADNFNSFRVEVSNQQRDNARYPIQVRESRGAKRSMGLSSGVLISDWFLAIVLASLAAIPWLRWRFSLRTLLIATTLVAVVLGLAVWSIH